MLGSRGRRGLGSGLLMLAMIGQAVSATTMHQAAPAAASKLSKIHAVTPMTTDKEQVTPDFLDDLKAGRPRLLVISLEHSDVTRQADALRKQRQLAYDDAAIIEMKTKAYSTLKVEILNGYGRAEIQVVRDYPSLAQIMVRVDSLKVLQRLLDDARISHVSSPMASLSAPSGSNTP
ncbi:MAG TPA: hypothetical protein VGN70_13015 [Gammaproteobacteria bacterium]|jgi:hypothetical protein